LIKLVLNSEKDGTHGLQPHSSLGEPKVIKGLKINNMMAQHGSMKNYKGQVALDVPVGITLFELKKLVIDKIWSETAIMRAGKSTAPLPLPIHITKVGLNRPAGSKHYHDVENGRTVKECDMKAETLNITEKSTKLQSQVPLFNDDMTDINERATFIFDQMFQQFSVSDPGLGELKVMGRQEVANFVDAITTNDFKVPPFDSRVTGILKYAKTLDASQEKLTREDFIQYYREGCFDRVELVRQNLTEYNYR
jgi:hypothetical protein